MMMYLLTTGRGGYINKATELKIVEGDGDGKFRPEDSVNYECAKTL